jgi:hypothetical protein
VYSCFSLGICSLLWSIYAVLIGIGINVHPNFTFSSSVAVAIVSSLAAYAIYRIALFTTAQYGELFKAAFDVVVARQESFAKEVMDVGAVLEHAVQAADAPELRRLNEQDKVSAVWRYLNNHRIRCPICRRSVPAPAFRSHWAAHGDARHPERDSRT